ncbi:Fic family protein [cf. Phormidesmis sp. LEGE 11477]|uniref:Fic family protein n=1 Tax=cf. Phormidesmis sp. LEGE 11477 TaxID=1828680 RepID=UPI00187EDABC|nr:Fic family protein [cf. Phormidesmis sp. LEGE 11477]MBE9064350.1 Fic family protein [cf. Phormidesmis sp. LEGE 11477]
MTAQLYDALIAQLVAHPSLTVAAVLDQILSSKGHAMQLSDQLAQIDRLKGWLDSFRPLPSSVVRELKQRYDVRFTYQSNAIEGNTLSQSETELVLSKGITIGGKTLIEHLEVVGHKEAIDYIESLSQAESPIGEWEIRQIHALVTRKISPDEAGRYRQLDVKAAGTDYVYPPYYLLPGLMNEFVQWLQTAGRQTHPVLYASEAHYRFVSVHPFADGNGRTGRLLLNLLLLRAGFPIVSISNERRTDYIDALSAAQQSQDDLSLLFSLVCDMAIASLIETLSVVASAAESRTKGQPFYQEVIAFLK